MTMDLDAGHKARWQRVSVPSQVDANGLAARAELIEEVTGEQYDVQSLRGLPYEAELCSFELDTGRIHPAGLLWTTRVNGMRARILVFAIAVEFQGIGLGSQVWGMMREDLRSLGIAKVQLEVHSNNVRALRLYERLGMKQVGIIRDYYVTGDGILMEWNETLIR